MVAFVGRLIVLAAIGTAGAVTFAQSDPGDGFRVFLRDGQALPSHGDWVLVSDRVIFTLEVGGPARPAYQLISLPIERVDVARSERYREAMRAARYAATRGEADYRAMTEEVARALDQLAAIPDPKQRLALAEEARRRLLAWSREHYSYRAGDIIELAGLFDQVIAEMRIVAGESAFSLDFTAGPARPDFEPLRAQPSLRESIALALGAAAAADSGEDRLAVLRLAAAILSAEPEDHALRAEVALTLAAEEGAEAAYAELGRDLLARAGTAVADGSVAGVESVRQELDRRDLALGGRRPQVTAGLRERLTALAEAALARRIALDHYTFARPGRLAYERRVRPMMSGLDGLMPVLEALRGQRGTAFSRLEKAIQRADALAADLGRVTPPDDLADVHATLTSAVHLAQQSLGRWRAAVVTGTTAPARESSAAAAGSLLLSARARADLVERLYPPKIR